MRSAVLLGALALAVVSALPRGRVVKRQVEELREGYDFVVVGGGTAGLTVADRLSEAFPELTILVIEYGTIEQAEAVFEPPGGGRGTTRLDLVSEPIAALNGRRASVAAGMTVGGSSTVNGQFFDRGSRFDYDDWAAIGEDGGERWDWEGMLPFFKKSVTFHEPSEEDVEAYGYTYDVDAAYGGKTPVHAVYAAYQFPIQKIVWDAFVEMGLPERQECASGNKDGICWVPASQHPTTAARSHSGLAHYADIIDSRSNYDLLVGHKVTRLLFEDGVDAAPLVEFKPVGAEGESEVTTVRVGLEVVVSAGALHTPQILQRSGVGEKKFLEGAGIGVVVDLPGVGWNFQDHPGAAVSYTLAEVIEPNQASLGTNETFRDEALSLYEERPARGPYTLAMGNSAIYVPLPNITSSHELITSAILAQVEDGSALSYLTEDVPLTVAEGYLDQLTLLAASHANPEQPILEAPWISSAPATAFLLKPLSRGSVRLNASDPDGEPVVDYRTAENPIDLDVMASFTPFFRRYFATGTMAALGPTEVAPGAEVTDAEEIKEWLRGVIIPSLMHPCCTASMMPESKGGVVGSDLRVHGFGGVRVADISVVPIIPGAHTSATAYAIGEKASDIIIRAHSGEGEEGGGPKCKNRAEN